MNHNFLLESRNVMGKRDINKIIAVPESNVSVMVAHPPKGTSVCTLSFSLL